VPEREAPADSPFVVGYTGNLGIAQGLSIVLDAAERLRGRNVRFLLVGDGPLSSELRAERARRGLDAVEIRHGVPVSRIGEVLGSCDALLVPLRNHPLLDDFIPSKLYDAMAAGRPVLLAARGESANLLAEAGGGVRVDPEDDAALAEAILELAGDRKRARALGEAGRLAARQHTRSRQLERLEDVLREAAAAPDRAPVVRRPKAA
jgi:glycosyltransferase involved in cell wall biosynthesis